MKFEIELADNGGVTVSRVWFDGKDEMKSSLVFAGALDDGVGYIRARLVTAAKGAQERWAAAQAAVASAAVAYAAERSGQPAKAEGVI